MSYLEALSPEWERIDLLAAGLSAIRSGKQLDESLSSRLASVNDSVALCREQHPWSTFTAKYSLTTLQQDIIACSLAGEAEPRLGWMYRELQPGIAASYPTPALIRELFFLRTEDISTFRQCFTPSSTLLKRSLIEPHSGDSFSTIHPSSTARALLLGEELTRDSNIPGAIEIEVQNHWDELVLPADCMTKLREFMYWVTHREIVIDKWRGRKFGGPLALFSGASGTGKTFAAEALAQSLDFPLYRVDLGMLVSKYIGETEKNLNALFDAAQGRDIVLLFDEADALFGKRAEVNDARDRYANMEVSHLLSRIENHGGPCILTTNLRHHLDSAFTRRIQMVIEFPRPTSEARARLWKQHLPPGAPIDAELNFEDLGKDLALTGGQIRNAALHAAFLAAAEDMSINPAHIARAVWSEFSKQGGELILSSLGKFENDLPKEMAYATN